MFSAIRAGLVDFGITERPCCRCQRSITCAGVLPCVFGDATDDRVFQGAGVLAVAVEGDAADRRPRLGEDAVLRAEGLHVALLEVGVDLDLVHRRHHRGRPSRVVRWSTMKLLTPIARTFPSASSVSNARYASSVDSNSDGSA